MKRVLGLDLGTNSAGWVLMDVPTEDGEIGAVIDMGARVFPEQGEIKANRIVTKTAERRVQRSMRRQIARRTKRKMILRMELIEIDLLPDDDDSFQKLMDLDPNSLLAQSANGSELTQHQIGRVLYWFSTKRGFLSLRTGGSQVVDGDEDFVPTRYRLTQADGATGEVVHVGQEDAVLEFLTQQKVFHPNILTETRFFGRRGRLNYPVKPVPREAFLGGSGTTLIDEFGIHGVIFFQRSVYWDRKTIGVCSLNPQPGKVRAARAERVAQRFSIWTTINNLRVDSTRRELTLEEKQKLFTLLWNQQTMSFDKVRSTLGLLKEIFINFDRGGKEGLKGNETDGKLKGKLGESFTALSEGQKDALVYLLLGDAGEVQARAEMVKKFGFTQDQAGDALLVALPSGRMRYSRATLRKLLPFIESGEGLDQAIIKAGFINPDTLTRSANFEIESVTNPLARGAFTQMLKVMDAVSKSHSRPGLQAFDVVRIELARDVSNNAKDRERITKQQRENEKARKSAQKTIEEYFPGAEESRDLIRKVRLWQSQGEQCLYCGNPILPTSALSASTEIDHILPRSLTLNNSENNVALVHSNENQEKGDRTVFEWGGQQKVDEIIARGKSLHLPYGKLKNLAREHVDDQAIPSSLLVTTGQITIVARKIVQQKYGIEPEITRGRLTAALRSRMGVIKDPEDHRRHALDAAMVCLTDTRISQLLAREFKSKKTKHGNPKGAEVGWEPWVGCRSQIMDRYNAIIVSHRASRKMSGQLHKETFYGKVKSPYGSRSDLYARRRLLSSGLTKPQLDQVADPIVKRALLENLRSRGIDPTTASKFTFDMNDLPHLPSGVVIKSIRTHINMPSARILKPNESPKTAVELGNNFAAYIYSNQTTGKWRIHIINRLDAQDLRGKKEKIRHKLLKKPDEIFLYSLSIGESVLLSKNKETDQEIVIVVKMTGNYVYFRPQNSGLQAPLPKSASDLQDSNARKVLVTPIGDLRRARD